MKISSKLTERFPVNNVIAEKQDEYFTVPTNKDCGVTAFAFELDEADIQDIIEHKKIYITLLSGNGGMQPINVSVSPLDFDDAIEYNHEFMKDRGFTESKLTDKI